MSDKFSDFHTQSDQKKNVSQLLSDRLALFRTVLKLCPTVKSLFGGHFHLWRLFIMIPLFHVYVT